MPSIVPPCLAVFVLACGSGGGREVGETPAGNGPSTGAVDASTGADATSSGGTTPTPTTSDSGIEGSSGTTAQLSGTSTGDSTGAPGSSGELESSGGFKLDLPAETPIPVHDIPGLKSITFYEATSGVAEYTFTVDGPELNAQLLDPLSQQNRDIQGTDVEFYDVYYSDEDGAFNPDGSYLTIAGSFGAKLPAGGGLNLAEISLNYENNDVEFGSFLASFLGLGDNYIAGSEPNAIDGDLDTHTTMGNNVDQPGMRLRVTLGFKSSLMPG